MAIVNIPKELKLNKFEFTRPRHVRDLVGRSGYASMPAGSYTGDETALMPQSKLQQLTFGYKLVCADIDNSKTPSE